MGLSPQRGPGGSQWTKVPLSSRVPAGHDRAATAPTGSRQGYVHLRRTPMSSRSRLVPVAVAVLMVSGCAGSNERARPIPLGPVESGPNSLESVRRVFEGSWDLV